MMELKKKKIMLVIPWAFFFFFFESYTMGFLKFYLLIVID